jgi:hypothetical protein
MTQLESNKTIIQNFIQAIRNQQNSSTLPDETSLK